MTTIINGRFTLGKVLGSGMQAEVRKGIDNDSNKTVALKIIDKTSIKCRSLDSLEREVAVMKEVRHRHVLRLRAVSMETRIENRTVAVLVLEMAEEGDLFDYLLHTGHFEEVLARTYFRQLLGALQCCHRHGIHHRDIKPENLLLNARFELKLADFGLSSCRGAGTRLYSEVGTRTYMAPEVLSCGEPGYSGPAADVWSAAVTLFVLLAGAPPFEEAAPEDWWYHACSMNHHDRFWAAHERTAPHLKSLESARSLLSSIFCADPKQRLTLEQIEQHDWTSGQLLGTRELAVVMRARGKAPPR